MRLLMTLPLLAACAAPVAAPAPVSLPLFGNGYRADGDQCRRVGESAATVNYLDDAADLVACPAGMENLGVFALDTGGREVARIGDYVLYSVPTR